MIVRRRFVVGSSSVVRRRFVVVGSLLVCLWSFCRPFVVSVFSLFRRSFLHPHLIRPNCVACGNEIVCSYRCLHRRPCEAFYSILCNCRFLSSCPSVVVLSFFRPLVPLPLPSHLVVSLGSNFLVSSTLSVAPALLILSLLSLSLLSLCLLSLFLLFLSLLFPSFSSFPSFPLVVYWVCSR